MARTVILPTLAHSSSSCWWYFLANLMNSRLPTSSPNLSRFWLTRGLILTEVVAVMPPCYNQNKAKVKGWTVKQDHKSEAETSHAHPPDTAESTKVYVLYARTNRGIVQWMGCERQGDNLDFQSDYCRVYIHKGVTHLLSYTKHTVSIFDSMLMWPVSINSLISVADWCTVRAITKALTCCPNNRLGWLILSNHAYPSAHPYSSQSEWVMCPELIKVLLSQGHVTSDGLLWCTCDISSCV